MMAYVCWTKQMLQIHLHIVEIAAADAVALYRVQFYFYSQQFISPLTK